MKYEEFFFKKVDAVLHSVMNFQSTSKRMISNTDESNYIRKESEMIIYCHRSKNYLEPQLQL